MGRAQDVPRLRILYCDDQEGFRERFVKDHAADFDITAVADIGSVIGHLLRADELPSVVLLDLYHPLAVENFGERAAAANRKLGELHASLKELKRVVDEAWAPAAVPVLQELRRHFSARELPVMIYTQRGLLLLDDREIRQIEECEADWLLKDERISPSTETIRIEQFVRRSRSGAALGPRDPSRVMVVHGRNLDAAAAIVKFLESLGLRPIAWEEAVRQTGRGAPYNLEAVQAAMSAAQAVVVVMTAEDGAALLEPLARPGDSDGETRLAGQPRPNVFFEAGLAMGIDAARTLFVELGSIRNASDLDGLNVVRLTNATESRASLRDRLRTAGCAIDDSTSAWRSARGGKDFESCVIPQV